MDNVVKILNKNGFSDVFREQLLPDGKYLKNIFLPKIKTTIRDQAVQALFEKINNETLSFPYYKDLITFNGLQKNFKNAP